MAFCQCGNDAARDSTRSSQSLPDSRSLRASPIPVETALRLRHRPAAPKHFPVDSGLMLLEAFKRATFITSNCAMRTNRIWRIPRSANSTPRLAQAQRCLPRRSLRPLRDRASSGRLLRLRPGEQLKLPRSHFDPVSKDPFELLIAINWHRRCGGTLKLHVQSNRCALAPNRPRFDRRHDPQCRCP